jgi:DNA-binding winged helix-turn-helix (wHTH) protein
MQAKQLYEFGPFRLNIAERMLLRGGETVPLTPKAVDILVLLVERSGHLLEREELLKAAWADSFVEEANLTVSISALRKALGEQDNGQQYIETVPKRGYRFVADVRKFSSLDEEIITCEWTTSSIVIEKEQETNDDETRLIDQSSIEQQPGDLLAFSPHQPSAPPEFFEPVGGAVPLDSHLYIVRFADEQFQSALARYDGIVLVKGARQVGKTSLLARGLEKARGAGAKVALTDFQMLNSSHLNKAETLLLALAGLIAEQLDLDVQPEDIWNPNRGPSINLERYLRQEVLNKTSSQIVWGLDEIDRLFACDFASEIFGLFRSWYNRRALEPDGPWQRLTLAIAYATEAHLFITDLNQSPFNVGTRLVLEDFTLEQVSELNRRYGSPLKTENEVAHYTRLVGGHPYLTQRGLYEMAAHGTSLSELETHASSDQGPFGDHLRRLLLSLSQASGLYEALREVLEGRACPDAESFYRLRSAGVLRGDSARAANPRCQLYAIYLREHL